VNQARRPPALAKLLQRAVTRTQLAVGHATPLADMTLMFDNSRSSEKAFSLVRAQQKNCVLFDCRDPRYSVEDELRAISDTWLARVVGPFSSSKKTARGARNVIL
jgi:hypothetical protein